MSRLKYLFLGLLLLPALALAAPTTQYFTNIAPTIDSTYTDGTPSLRWLNLYSTYASTTALSATTLCLSGDCRSSWASGSGSSPFATTTSSVAGENVIYPLNNTDILTVGGNSTTTADFFLDPNTNTSYFMGNVGIATTGPSTNLSLGGNLIVGASTAGGTNGTLTYGGVTLANSVTGTGSMVLSASPTLSGTVTAQTIRGSSSATTVALWTGSSVAPTTGRLDVGATSLTGSGQLKMSFAAGGIGIGTTTPQWPFQIATSSTANTFRPQFTISDTSSAANNHWTFANEKGNLYISTSSPLTFATSSASALSIDTNGEVKANCFTYDGVTCIQSALASYPFTNATNYGVNMAATSSPIWGQAGFAASSSSAYPTLGVQQAGAGPVATFLGGNVGVGTAAPSSPFHVFGASSGSEYNAVRLQNGQTAHGTAVSLTFNNTSSLSTDTGGKISVIRTNLPSSENNDMVFYTSADSSNRNLERVRFTGVGNVGVGTSSPWAMFSIHHPATGAAIPIFVVASSTATATSTLFMVNNNGNVGIASTTPYALLSVQGAGATTGVNFQTTNNSQVPLFSVLDSGHTYLGQEPASYGKLHLYDAGTSVEQVIGVQGNNTDTTPTATLGFRTRDLSTDTGDSTQIVTGRDANYSSGTLRSANLQFLVENTDILYEVARFTSLGKFGVGSSTPYGQLSASSTSATPALAVQQNGAGIAASFLGGNIGVGTTSPTALLTLGTAAPVIDLTDTDTNATSRISANSGAGTLSLAADVGNVSNSSNITFSVDGNEQARITGTGRLGIGTTSPYATLSIAGDTVLGASAAGGTPGDLYLPKLGTPAGTFLAVDGTGKVIATTSPTGSNYFTNSGIYTYLSTGTNLGVGTTTPGSLFSVGGNTTGTNFYDNATTSKKGIGGYDIAGGCFSINGVCIVPGSAAAAGATGNIQFNNGASALAADANLQWDNVNKLFGVGTSTPATTTSIGGDVLIGASTAGGANGSLTYGGIRFANTTTGAALGSMVTSSGPTFSGTVTIPTMRGGTAATTATILTGTSSTAPTTGSLTLGLTSGAGTGAPKMSFAGNFGVGIGTTTPAYTLQLASSSASATFRPQLALTDSSSNTNVHMTFANEGGNFYMATSSAATYATSTNTIISALAASGNVGIGTSSPQARLTVAGNLCVTTGPGSATTACDSRSGYISATNFVLGSYDLAERYPSKEDLEPGDVVALDTAHPGFIKKAHEGDIIMGVISTNPAVSLGGSDPNAQSPEYHDIALNGRVPVKVTGEVHTGDKLTLDTDGKARVAQTGESIIGLALSDSSEGMAQLFVHIEFAENTGSSSHKQSQWPLYAVVLVFSVYIVYNELYKRLYA